MSHSDLPRLAILGAGPIGLEVALRAATFKIPFTVYERGQIGEHLRCWGHVRLFSPFATNSTPLGRARLQDDHPHYDLPAENEILTGREHVASYLLPLSQSPLLREHIRTETTVLQVGRRGFLKEEASGDPRRGQQPFLLLLRTAKRETVETADVVFDCTGTYGQARSLGDGGIPAIGETAARPHIAWGVEDILGERRGVYADKTTLVVGSGYSAATTVCNLAKLAEKHPATWAIWLARCTGPQPIKRVVNDPLKERDLIAVRANMLATRGDGNVEFHAHTIVTGIECAGADKGFKVHTLRAGKSMTWEVDRLIANVGYTPDHTLYRELQVHEWGVTRGPMTLADSPPKHVGGNSMLLSSPSGAVLRNREPYFFVLGAKSYRRNSSFLLHVGFEQIREVFNLLTSNSELTSRFAGLRQLARNSR